MAWSNPAAQEFLKSLRRQCRVSTSGVESLGEGWITTIVIKIVPGQSPTVTVTDMTNKTSTTVQDSALQISGKKIGVVIAGSLLPSTGLAPSHYRYDFWPEDGLAGSTNIASFAPEFHDIQVGVAHRA